MFWKNRSTVQWKLVITRTRDTCTNCFLQYLVLFSSCKYLWFWAKCLKILFFQGSLCVHFYGNKWKILFFKPKYFFSSSKILFSSSKILFSFIRGWHLWRTMGPLKLPFHIRFLVISAGADPGFSFFFFFWGGEHLGLCGTHTHHDCAVFLGF